MDKAYATQQLENPFEELMKISEMFSESVKQLAKEKEAQEAHPEKELVLWTGIAGVQFYLTEEGHREEVLERLISEKAKLVLIREPDNPYDQWAIRVETEDGLMLGHITRFKNETIARMMDHGHIFEVQVENPDEEELANLHQRKTRTEQFILPFSVWLVH